MLVASVEDELELELLKLDPPDCWLRKPPLDVEDDDDDLVPEVVVVWAVVVALVLVAARWLPMVTPTTLKPSMAATAAPRFIRLAMRSASAFVRLGAGLVVGADCRRAGGVGAWAGTAPRGCSPCASSAGRRV